MPVLLKNRELSSIRGDRLLSLLPRCPPFQNLEDSPQRHRGHREGCSPCLVVKDYFRMTTCCIGRFSIMSRSQVVPSKSSTKYTRFSKRSSITVKRAACTHTA